MNIQSQRLLKQFTAEATTDISPPQLVQLSVVPAILSEMLN
jgi:hypothetical protein